MSGAREREDAAESLAASATSPLQHEQPCKVEKENEVREGGRETTLALKVDSEQQ
jgi:hypothetical protein